jgi:cell division protein FtsB
LNLRPISYEPTALTTELRPHMSSRQRRGNRGKYSRLRQRVIQYQVSIMQTKIKQLASQMYDYGDRFRDVRFAGLMVFVVIVLLISWSGVKVIQTNYQLQKQIAQLGQENSVQQLKDDNLKLQNGYYNTNQYLELSARQNFGLGMPGEKLLIVPSAVAQAHSVDLAKTSAVTVSSNLPLYQQNLQSWWSFFRHQQ